jgi:hypothetical protein
MALLKLYGKLIRLWVVFKRVRKGRRQLAAPVHCVLTNYLNRLFTLSYGSARKRHTLISREFLQYFLPRDDSFRFIERYVFMTILADNLPAQTLFKTDFCHHKLRKNALERDRDF